MSAITAVLVVPHAPDSAGLLREGQCGARPPSVYRQRQDPRCDYCGAKARWSSAPTEQSDSCYVCSTDWRHEGITYQGWSKWQTGSLGRESERALPLWWADSFVPEGWLRLQLATMIDQPGVDTADLTLPLRIHQTQWPTQDEALQLARLAVRYGRAARVVCLDSDGKEVSS